MPSLQVSALSLELTPRTLSTITSPIFSEFVLELGKLLRSTGTLGLLRPDRRAFQTAIFQAWRIQAHQNGQAVTEFSFLGGGGVAFHLKRPIPLIDIGAAVASVGHWGHTYSQEIRLCPVHRKVVWNPNTPQSLLATADTHLRRIHASPPPHPSTWSRPDGQIRSPDVRPPLIWSLPSSSHLLWCSENGVSTCSIEISGVHW